MHVAILFFLIGNFFIKTKPSTSSTRLRYKATNRQAPTHSLNRNKNTTKRHLDRTPVTNKTESKNQLLLDQQKPEKQGQQPRTNQNRKKLTHKTTPRIPTPLII
jgi:hypothetical protein